MPTGAAKRIAKKKVKSDGTVRYKATDEHGNSLGWTSANAIPQAMIEEFLSRERSDRALRGGGSSGGSSQAPRHPAAPRSGVAKRPAGKIGTSEPPWRPSALAQTTMRMKSLNEVASLQQRDPKRKHAPTTTRDEEARPRRPPTARPAVGSLANRTATTSRPARQATAGKDTGSKRPAVVPAAGSITTDTTLRDKPRPYHAAVKAEQPGPPDVRAALNEGRTAEIQAELLRTKHYMQPVPKQSAGGGGTTVGEMKAWSMHKWLATLKVDSSVADIIAGEEGGFAFMGELMDVGAGMAKDDYKELGVKTGLIPMATFACPSLHL